MLPFQIKICGITNVDDALSACHCGADAIGLNFFKRSPRFLDEKFADVVVKAIDIHNTPIEQSGADDKPVQGRNPKCHVRKIGVFVNDSVNTMVETANKHNLDGVQLHGDEHPQVIAALRAKLNEARAGCLLIRAIGTNPATREASESTSETYRVASEILDWTNAGIDAILLDAAVPGEFGGTGEVVDWSSIPDLKCEVPLILAGGLKPGNVSQAISVSGVKSVDVASGVESEPGNKDHDKIQAFIVAARKELDSPM